ncbi:hypothetical protein L596_028253 [Steinernema carpocapsae]|uniref:Uncharacterized protein n=1 Tax=Steinernema carpocapsae TaxID=34508 RepID=A0A4U5LY02_STECR|nr:hypothetical protein L596_028253 [Steinernema carpocapsae]
MSRNRRPRPMWGGSDSGRKLVEVKTPKVPSSKEKWKIKQLNCCQNPSMASSGVSTIPEVSSSIDDHLQGSIPDIPPEIAQQITQQLTNYNLKSKSLRQVVSSDSIASSPHHVKISASCQPSPVRSAALQQTLSVQNIPLESRHHRKSSASAIPKAATTRRKDSVESIRREKKNSASSRVRSKERRSSLESSHASAIPSPYSKVTNAKTVDHGAYSSGHGSDETGSVVHCRPSTSLNANGGIPSSASKRNRESFSASSGYESADYGRYKSKGNFMDAKMGKLPVLNAKSAKTSLASPSINPQLQAAIDHLYALRAHLQAELAAAKRRIGSLDDSSPSRAGDRYLDANPETVLETLSQETRILEKRIAACQSHAMLVTSFL